MRKLWIGLLVLAILCFAAVLIVPSFFDWNAHKKRIALAVLDATGRELTIRGDIDVTILPSPGLRVSDVRFANVYGAAAPDMVRLDEARVSIDIAPLLEGRIAAVVTLVKPNINLETLKDGRTSWDFHTKAPAAESAPKKGQAANSSSITIAGVPFDVELRNFRVVDGTVSYYDARSGFFERIDRVKSRISFDSLAGPFRVSGEGLFRGVPAEIDVSAGVIHDGAPLPLSIDLRSRRGDSEVLVQGKLSKPGLDGEFRGEVKATSANAGALVAALTREVAPAALSQAFSLTTRITASRSGLDADTLRFSLGKARGAGIVSAEFGDTPDIKIRLNSDNLVLEGFDSGTGAKPEFAPRDAAGADEAGHASARLPKKKPRDGSLLPANVDASLQLQAQVIQYREAVVRDVSILGSLHKGQFTLVNAQATVPGNSRIEAKGTITSDRNDLALDIDLKARSDNLREVAEWLGVDVSGIPPDKLRRFNALARFTGRPSALTAPKFKVTLDASTITGGINLALRDRPAFGLRLAVDRFNLDGYLPGRGIGASDGTKQHPASKSSPGTSPVTEFMDALRRFDANIDAHIQKLTVAKTPARDLRVDMTVVNGGLRVRQATLKDFAGVQGTLKGEISQGGATPSVRLDYDVRVVDRKRFARFLGNGGSFRRYLTGQAEATGRLSGTVEKLSVESRIGAMGGELAVKGTVSQPILAPQFDLAVKAAFPEFVGLIQAAAPNYSPAAGKLGAFDIKFKASGTPVRFALNDLAGTFGPVRAKGNATVDLSGTRPNVTVSASTSEVLIDLFLPPVRAASYSPVSGYRIVPAAAGGPARPSRWSAEPFDLSALSAFDGRFAVDMAAFTKDPYRLQNVKVRAALTAGMLKVTDATANFSTGTLKGEGSLGRKKSAVDTEIRLEGKDIDVAAIAPVLRNYQFREGPMHFGVRMTGPVSMNLTLRSQGKTERGLVSGLKGTGHLTGNVEAKLSEETQRATGLADLAGQLLGNKVKDLQRYTGVASAPGRLAEAFDGPATLNGDFDIEQGVVRTDNLVLVGRKGRALTTGNVELPSWRLSTRTDVTLVPEKEAFLTVEMGGPLEEPYVRKIGGTLYKPATAPRTPRNIGKSTGEADKSSKSKQPEPSKLPRFTPEDLLKEFKEYKGLLDRPGR